MNVIDIDDDWIQCLHIYCTCHYILWNAVDLVVHDELLVGGELHDDDAEVGAAQVQRQELAVLLTVRQSPHVSRETLDAGLHLAFLGQTFL